MIRERASQILFNYWNEVRGSAVAPRRLDIEPARISGILSDTFILEHGEAGPVFRLAGTRMCDRFGQELRGRGLWSLWSEEDRPELQRMLEEVVGRGAAGLIELSLESDGEPALAAEALILPLLHDGEVTRLLGVLSVGAEADWVHPMIARTPRLVHALTLWPDGRPHQVIESVDRQAPFLAHTQQARIVRHQRLQLRVYDGGLSVGKDAGKA